MIKRFPSRNYRSKGIKVKHILQIILLLGVCFWLIYQVKHNHDKKKEFVENDAKLSVRTQTDQILQLGRKGLHPVRDEVNQNKKHGEEEEDEHIVENEENKHEHDDQEEGNKHETEESEDNKHGGREQGEEENNHGAEEQEEDENQSEDMEDQGRGGDGDIDENDEEKSEVDIDRGDEFIDEEKEKEEEGDDKENEKREDEEKGGLAENHNNNHEAREENYKGDDASSAVAHDTHATSTETETFRLENSDANLEMNITKSENETTYSDESNRNQNDSDVKVTEGEVMGEISSNATAGKETGNNSLFNLVDSSYLNKTATTSNLTVAITEAAGANTSTSSEQNKTVILSESDHAQNTTMNTTITGDVKNVQKEGLEQSSNRISEENLPDTNSTVSAKTENGDAAAGETSYPVAGELEKTIRFVASNETENTSKNLDGNESSYTSESDKSEGNTETSEAIESVEHDAIDSSDTHIHEDVTEVRTDLDTLPDIRNEGDNDDETAAE
ncbi:uncharacterized protein LOC133300154 [Gastrolobium bilobum]|uniref:uncharacterized protein LOC133300154 n=1 Tax=Gastrolobium bilobum TaxID=150636 RepID=UPI002AB1068A|nr:uncharacterized protein LOC133300154 [Gastrolobium bilobum]